LVIRAVDYRPRFAKELGKLSPELLAQAKDAIDGLLKNRIPTALRLHCVDKNANPKIFTIDVTSNKSHKISFHMEGDVAYLRRVGTHKEIDRLP
jgi:mRNA-degrading endonuclease RelE of RelBE toxin-antitoxin system